MLTVRARNSIWCIDDLLMLMATQISTSLQHHRFGINHILQTNQSKNSFKLQIVSKLLGFHSSVLFLLVLSHSFSSWVSSEQSHQLHRPGWLCNLYLCNRTYPKDAPSRGSKNHRSNPLRQQWIYFNPYCFKQHLCTGLYAHLQIGFHLANSTLHKTYCFFMKIYLEKQHSKHFKLWLKPCLNDVKDRLTTLPEHSIMNPVENLGKLLFRKALKTTKVSRQHTFNIRVYRTRHTAAGHKTIL